MFKLNRGRPVSPFTVLRVVVKSFFIKSSGQLRWKGIFAVLALGLLSAFSLGLFSPQQTASSSQVANVASAPAPVNVQTNTNPAVTPHAVAIRFVRGYNGAYRVLDIREDALEGTSVRTATMSMADFKSGMASYMTADGNSLLQTLDTYHAQYFQLTAGVDEFTVVTDGTDNVNDFIAALKANRTVADAHTVSR